MPQSILTEKHYQACDKALRDCGEIRSDLEKCRDCGLPTEEREERLRFLEEFASKIIQQFFPGRR